MKRLKKYAALLLAVLMLASVLTVPASAYEEAEKLSSGNDYILVPALDKCWAMDLYDNDSSDGQNIQVYPAHWGDSQVFKITEVYGGWYKIVHTDSGKVLDIKGGNSAYGNVILWPYHGGDNQLWSFETVWVSNQRAYRIKSKMGSSYLAVNKYDNNNVRTSYGTSYDTSDDSQIWYLQNVATPAIRLEFDEYKRLDTTYNSDSEQINLKRYNSETIKLQVRVKNFSRIELPVWSREGDVYNHDGFYCKYVGDFVWTGTYSGYFKLYVSGWEKGVYKIDFPMTKGRSVNHPHTICVNVD